MDEASFRRENPGVFFLTDHDPAVLTDYLREIRVLRPAERVSALARAGQGNMNLTVRARADARSFIVKQSRPWVERFPSIEAPHDRVLSEAAFYEMTASHPAVTRRLPRVIEVDPRARVIVLEDLGEATDFSHVYAGQPLSPDAARTLSEWLAELHAIEFLEAARRRLTNRSMRQLNHEHIFRLPLDADNGLDLDAITPGLQTLADRLIGDVEYVRHASAIGRIYLSDGPSLLHGDFFPGSWLRGDDGPMIIDHEFAFFGPAEFDVGVLLAHLYLAGQPEATHAAAIEGYAPRRSFDWRLALRFAGAEIMRRLIGVAQLPLTIDLAAKRRMLDLSHALLTSATPGDIEGLIAKPWIVARRQGEAGAMRL